MIDKEIFELRKIENSRNLGSYVCIGPTKPIGEEAISNQSVEINFTGKPGTASAIYYSLFFQLPKWDWRLEKADEWIEVTPTHKEYYERTMATKQMLESTIKTGLASAAQAVADFELLSHDLRKYKEIVGYFEKKNELSLKSMFIDQVDRHTDVLSIAEMTRNRWPTLTADFHRLDENDMDPEKIKDKLNVSKAEAIILATKNKLYLDWKELFGKAVEDRYEGLRSLVLSREKSIKEYKEWLKPYIARFKTTSIGGEVRRPDYMRSFMDIAGLSTFTNKIRMFAWKPLYTREVRRPSEEIIGPFKFYPYDDYVRNKIILNPEGGLAETYPWLRNPRKYCEKCKKYFPDGILKCSKCGNVTLEERLYVDEIVEEKIIKDWKGRGGDPYELYYMFLDIDIDRLGIRLPSGELEDITFTDRMYVISQNILLVKILELLCRDMELELYIEEMLGFRRADKDINELITEDFPEFFKKEKQELKGVDKFAKELKDNMKAYTNFFGSIKLPKTKKLMFVKPGHYETDLRDRVTKHFLAVSVSNLVQVSNFIKSKMGME